MYMITSTFLRKFIVLCCFAMLALLLGKVSPTLAATQQASTQSSTPNPIVWKTNFAKLSASDFYIRIGNVYYYGAEPIRVSSDPGNDKYTTLEVTWNEKNVEMRMFMYFQKRSDGEWEMYDLRTYNGNKNGDWIYYNKTDTIGNEVASIPGVHNYHAERRFKPKSGIDAEIYCRECSISAFLPRTLSYSNQGYALEIMTSLGSNETITLQASGKTGYGVNALLRDSSNAVVTDQSHFRYEWISQNSAIAQVYPGTIAYAEGGCAYDIKTPCPTMNGQIAGRSPGVTTIR